MAIVKKIIKFDLPIDGEKVKTVDELTDHLTVELVEHLKTGLLVKWLMTREPELAENIQKIEFTDKSDRELLIAILNGLGFEADEQIIDTMFMVHEQLQAKLNDEQPINSKYEAIDESATTSVQLCDIDVLVGDDVSGRKFVNCDFSGKNLSAVNFSDCVFEKSKFDNAILLGALFTRSKFDEVSFVEADLKNVNFENSEIVNSKFDNVKAEYAIFNEAKVNRSTFIQATLTNSNMNDITIINSDFSNSSMKNVSMIRADLKVVRFINSDFTGVEIGDVSDWENFKSLGCDYSNVKFAIPKSTSPLDLYTLDLGNFEPIYSKLSKNNTLSKKDSIKSPAESVVAPLLSYVLNHFNYNNKTGIK